MGRASIYALSALLSLSSLTGCRSTEESKVNCEATADIFFQKYGGTNFSQTTDEQIDFLKKATIDWKVTRFDTTEKGAYQEAKLGGLVFSEGVTRYPGKIEYRIDISDKSEPKNNAQYILVDSPGKQTLEFKSEYVPENSVNIILGASENLNNSLRCNSIYTTYPNGERIESSSSISQKSIDSFRKLFSPLEKKVK